MFCLQIHLVHLIYLVVSKIINIHFLINLINTFLETTTYVVNVKIQNIANKQLKMIYKEQIC